MPWNFMQIQMIKPMFGPGGLSREEATAEVQSLLDRSARAASFFRQAADAWRRSAKDNTVHAGPFIWTIYEYDADALRGAMDWLEDFARQIPGVNVQLPKLPDGGTLS